MFSGGFFFVWEGELRWEGGYVGGFSMEKLLMGKETFNEGGAEFFSII